MSANITIGEQVGAPVATPCLDLLLAIIFFILQAAIKHRVGQQNSALQHQHQRFYFQKEPRRIQSERQNIYTK